MGGDGLERLTAAVLADPALQQRLLAVPERPAFVAEVVAVAAERGLDVTPADVEAALVAARRAWLERWV
ncbi:MAG TPA: Nif11 family protein [Acidimicrobiales bacterium]